MINFINIAPLKSEFTKCFTIKQRTVLENKYSKKSV